MAWITPKSDELTVFECTILIQVFGRDCIVVVYARIIIHFSHRAFDVSWGIRNPPIFIFNDNGILLNNISVRLQWQNIQKATFSSFHKCGDGQLKVYFFHASLSPFSRLSFISLFTTCSHYFHNNPIISLISQSASFQGLPLRRSPFTVISLILLVVITRNICFWISM